LTGIIYIADSKISTLIGDIPYERHLFLVYDQDGNLDTVAEPGNVNEQQIIEGSPGTPFGGGIIPSNLIVAADSIINNTEKTLDTNYDGIRDRNPYELFNYTALDLNGQDAEAVWTQMVYFLHTLGTPFEGSPVTIDTGEAYPTLGLGTNSNSVINSVLNTVDLLPYFSPSGSRAMLGL